MMKLEDSLDRLEDLGRLGTVPADQEKAQTAVSPGVCEINERGFGHWSQSAWPLKQKKGIVLNHGVAGNIIFSNWSDA